MVIYAIILNKKKLNSMIKSFTMRGKMKILKRVLKGIICCIGAIILIVLLALGSLILYVILTSIILGRGDYLLIVTSSKLELIPVMMVMFLIMYGLFKLKERFFPSELDKELLKSAEDEPCKESERYEENEIFQFPIDYENDSRYTGCCLKFLNFTYRHFTAIEKLIKIIKYCYLPVLAVTLYVSLTSNTTVYKDRIKVTHPYNPKGIIYSYSDVKSIDVGIEKRRGDYTPYYRIHLRNNGIINLLGDSATMKEDMSLEKIILNIDSDFKKLGIPKKVIKSNFDSFAKSRDENYVSDINKLLQ